MPRIIGVDIPKEKKIEIALTYIYGIGTSSARRILKEANVDINKKVQDWNDSDLNKIRSILTEKFKVEGALRSETQLNIKRLIDIGTYRGIRHKKGMPVRGQRTRSNARTRKGRRKTIAGKKIAPSKG